MSRKWRPMQEPPVDPGQYESRGEAPLALITGPLIWWDGVVWSQLQEDSFVYRPDFTGWGTMQWRVKR